MKPKIDLDVESACSSAIAAWHSAAALAPKEKKPRVEHPWYSWSTEKKLAVAKVFQEQGYSKVKLQFGVCPPRSTVRGWVTASTAVKKPGRPTHLSAIEERALYAALSDVRDSGAVLDRERLQVMALEVIAKLRTDRPPMQLT